MKLHLITVGKPRLSYAKLGWDEYLNRLRRQHTVRITQLSDKYAYDEAKIVEAAKDTQIIALVIDAPQYTSPQLADFLQARELESREVSFVIGGPEGLPQSVINQASYTWSLGNLTLPHDLAMVVMLEALYRASTISAGQPYHK